MESFFLFCLFICFLTPNNRYLVLSLWPDNIDMFESMSCDEIIKYLIGLDENYYNLVPDFKILAKKYHDCNNDKLYQVRDLAWRWQEYYLKEKQIDIKDVYDERNCGSIRK